MSENPDKWVAFWKNLQLVIGALLAVTAAAFFDILGVVGLAIVWAVLYAVVATVYAVRFRSEARQAAASAPSQARPEDAREVGRLESELSQLRAQLRDAKGRLQERVEEQSSRMDIADELRKQLRRIPNLRTYEVPLTGSQRKNFALWQKRTIMFIGKAFGDGSDQVKEFRGIEFASEDLDFPYADYERGLDEAEVFLKVTIERLES